MVDFVRPGHLGTLEEFRNMFGNPINNGQCADSSLAVSLPRREAPPPWASPFMLRSRSLLDQCHVQDIKVMRNRTIVLQRLLASFVQRRDDSILRLTLPPRHEYVIPVRMTPWQELLYTTVSCLG